MRAAGESGQRPPRRSHSDRHPNVSIAPVGEPDARGIISRRMWVAMVLALGLHLGLLLWAYLQPPVPPPSRRHVVEMDVVKRKLPPPPKEPPKPETPEQEPPRSRPLPSLLQPVARKSPLDQTSPAIEVPVQPPTDKMPGVTGPPQKGPIELFPKNLGVGGAGAPGAAVPKGPNRLLKDERLEVKKEPDFLLVPEKGGGFKFDGSHFTAHIGADGALTFDDRGPIGVQKGGTFTFDLTDLVMRGHKQDPYGAEKRHFVEFTQKTRDELRGKTTQTGMDGALSSLPAELDEIWTTQRPAAVRRREIFERWVESSDDKDKPNSTGQKARRMIEAYVRKHMPQGSPLSYTIEELSRFAEAREGQPQFDPYRGR